MNTIEHRLEKLRKRMAKEHIDAWIITGSDPHSSEYVCSRWQTRSWISGFTGSAGTVVVTRDKALLWVDSRYFIQGEQQLRNTSFELQKLDTPQVLDHVQWLARTMESGSVIGFEASTCTVTAKRNFERAFIGKRFELVGTEDWFDQIWENRPEIPHEQVVEMEDTYVGYSRKEKIELIRKELAQQGCTHTIIASLDDIAWILNLRGSDIEYNPVFLAYLIIGPDSTVLCSDGRHFSKEVYSSLSKDVSILGYDEIDTALKTLASDGYRVYYSADKISVRLLEALPKQVDTVEGRDISTDLKSTKNKAELEGMRRAHLLDGVALVKFLARVKTSGKTYNEISLAEELIRCRSEHPEYLGPSFSPIAAYREHGALAHYSATEESAHVLEGDGLLVLDTGGQYASGTTDITRTLLFGTASDEMKRDYTLVLKGTITLAAQKFPKGTYGYQLDVLARQFLWQQGLSFGHGTGHGLGFRLNVHEGPQNISPRPTMVPLKAGMVISDEPGVYKEGRYGIRIENIVAVKQAETTEFGSFLAFEVLSFCPFERDLIDKDLLAPNEIQMIDDYHETVRNTLSPYLDEKTRTWLKEATAAL